MKIHLITATVIGLAGAGLAMSPAFATAPDAGLGPNQSSQQSSQRNHSWMGSSGNGVSQNTGLSSHEGSQQAQNRNHDWIGSSGNGSSHNTGLKSHESSAGGNASR